MYRSQNTKKNQNIGNPNNEIRNQIEAEDALLNMGNEAANMMAGLPNPDTNEANNDILGNVSPGDNENGMDHYLANDLNRFGKKKRRNRNKETGNDNILNIIDNTNEKDEPLIIANEPAPGKKGKKSSKKSKKAAVPEMPEDLTQIDQSLEPVQGWDFVAEGKQAKKLKPRKKQGFGSKLASWAAYYSGKTIGKIGGLFAWLGSSIKGLFSRGPGTLGGTFKRMRGSGRFQTTGDRSLIPGWDGAKFEDLEENQEQNPDEISLDFRRVPEVWSWPIAEKPTEGDAEKRDAKPRDPVISVYIAQGSAKYTAGNNLSTGHTGIGIEYSRYNAVSGRWQRYNLRFGYYMGGGTPLDAKMAVANYNNATIPGVVMNEQNKMYDVSRSYPAKPKQVSDVLRAAESYADRGGYNGYTRNCTTFAKEMIVDVAKIKGAESVFARDEVYLHHSADAKMFLAGAGAPIAKAAMENAFEKIGNKDDLNYQNFGNKMLSREEHQRYRNSMSLWSWRRTKADSPNAVAENLKRAEGGKAGMIGAYNSALEKGKEVSLASFENVRQTVPFLLKDLMTGLNGLQAITPAEKLSGNGKSQELEDLLKALDGDALSDKLTMLFRGMDDESIRGKAKQSNIMEARTLFSDLIKKLNTLLFRFYKNDTRVQKKVMDTISYLNHGLIFLDHAFSRTEEHDLVKEDSDLGDLGRNYQNKEYAFTVGGTRVRMTASEYEAWLQIYKTPEKALEQFKKYCDLLDKKRKKQINPAEEKELQNLNRINALATDFLRSHRYLLSKEKFNQQDVDYVFALEKKERQGNVDSEMFDPKVDYDHTMSDMNNPNASASGTYLMLIMKSIFGGMKDRFTQAFPDIKTADMDEVANWLSADTVSCITSHKKEMETILRGIKHSTNDPDKEKIEESFSNLLTRWIFQLFRQGTKKQDYIKMVNALTKHRGAVMGETEKLITSVMSEQVQ